MKLKSEPLSQVVKKMRGEAGFSIRKLASLVGVSHAAISQWEKEVEKVPYHRALKIAEVCGFDERQLDQLIGQYSETVDYLTESQKLLLGLDEKRIKAVHSILLCLNFEKEAQS